MAKYISSNIINSGGSGTTANTDNVIIISNTGNTITSYTRADGLGYFTTLSATSLYSSGGTMNDQLNISYNSNPSTNEKSGVNAMIIQTGISNTYTTTAISGLTLYNSTGNTLQIRGGSLIGRNVNTGTSSFVYGCQLGAYNDSNGVVSSLYATSITSQMGANSGIYTAIAGINMNVRNYSNNVSNGSMWGFANVVTNTGITNNLFGISTSVVNTGIANKTTGNTIKMTFNTGTTTLYGLSLGDPSNQWVGTCPNLYGIYIDSSVNGGTVNNYSIYNGSSAPSYFAGLISATTYYGDGSNLTGIPKVFTTGSSGSYSIKANNDSGLNATGDYSYAEGNGTKATGSTSHAEGQSTTASGDYSHSEGYSTIASGVRSHAEGSTTKSVGSSSHAEGNSTTASTQNSHAEGYTTLASGNNSHAEGEGTIASGISSHAEGNGTVASNNYSHAEGRQTLANGPQSHVEGYGSTASGDTSHAEGGSTKANGDYSHAEGNNTFANGYGSHTEGYLTTTTGTYSHAGGESSKSYGTRSFVHSYNSVINTGATDSAILGGNGNTVNANIINSIILGGSGITAVSGNTVYSNNQEIIGAGNGIIMASPNGTRYKLSIANGGTISITAV